MNYLKTIQKDLTPDQRLYQIVEQGMCIGCGICQSVLGPQKVKIEIVQNGCPRPTVSGELTHEEMDKVMDICPGTRVPGLPDWLVDETSHHDKVWGVWQEIYLAHATEPEVRFKASTGGVLTGIALFLIESGEVDFVLHACEPKSNPTFGERFISRNRSDVLRAMGSRYGPTPALIDVVQVIDQAEKADQKFAYIGTPHDVSALRNYARHDSRVDQYCKYMMVMVCGGFMGADNMKNFLGKMEVAMKDVTTMRYRGYGCPGATRLETKDGQVIEKNYLDFWGDDESKWGLPPRCKVCPDGIGNSADIAASDTWDGGSPDWESQKSDPGVNAAIVRTRRGVELMERAISSGYISRGETCTPDDMNRYQPHQENKKRAVWARFEGMKVAGNIVPETHGLELELLYQENTMQENEQQASGAKKRIEQGGFSEATPVKIS